MLTLRPEAVDMNAAKNFPSRQSDWTREFKRLRACGPNAFGWKIQDLSAEGVVGNAAAANAEAGAAILDHAAQGLAELLIDVHKFDLGELR
jgi:creatinine amidohydrolase